jgi:hypothetical protein
MFFIVISFTTNSIDGMKTIHSIFTPAIIPLAHAITKLIRLGIQMSGGNPLD